MFSTSNIAVAFLLFLILARTVQWRLRRSSLPPGPRPLPLVGNLFDITLVEPWKLFSEWGRRWGGLVYISLVGHPKVIVNSFKAASDLLEKRSAIYSDRPQLPSAQHIGYTNMLPFVGYGDRFREHRRLISQVIGSRSLVERFSSLQEHATHAFLQRLLVNPEEFAEHIKKLIGASMLVISYGYQIQEEGRDPFIEIVKTSAEDFAEAALTGAFLVDIIPALRYIPSWFPGGNWRKRATQFRDRLSHVREETFSYVKTQMANDVAINSFVSRNLELKSDPAHEDHIKWAGVALLGGGLDTSVSIIHSFFLAMTLYPDVQRKAQAEIDAVVGHDRLPTFRDRDQLSYVDALCKELLRWMPAAPFTAPHDLMQEDSYDRYVFSKGTSFIGNLWGMLHDPEMYKGPFEFVPERHIPTPETPAEKDPHSIAFGFGRRLCPGMHVADATMFIVTSSVLASFNIQKAVESGKVITPVVAQSSGTISHPLPFKCSIQPRSPNAEILIRATVEASSLQHEH